MLWKFITSPQFAEDRTWLPTSCTMSASGHALNYRLFAWQLPDCQAFWKTVKFCIAVFVLLSPRSRKQFPCNHIWRKTVGERQAVVWNKCCTRVCTKKSCVLMPCPCKPEQMVCGVSALGDRERPEGGVGRSAHQMTSYPSIDFFFL